MATCLDTIKWAMRRLQVLRIGKEPTAAEAVEGLAALEGLYARFATTGVFSRLVPEIQDAALTAEEQQRLITTTGGPYIVTMPSSLLDDGTGETRLPYDLAYVAGLVTVDGAQIPARWVYEADRAAWSQLYSLSLTTVAPLSFRDPGGLAACLAIDLADGFNVEPSGAVQRDAGVFLSNLSRRPSEPERPVEYTYF